MIIDSHTHAWEFWPYEPPVPDHGSRGRAEQLLWEMDRNGVDLSVIVCARIDHNPGNNDYARDVVRRHPDRFVQFADVDCSWSDTYHAPGAAKRLREAAERYQLKGFTHYLKADTDWFASAEGTAFFQTAADLGLIASLALAPAWQPALRELARRFPTVPFLCHHMAGARVGDAARLQQITASAAVPNIYVKLSGFHYVAPVSWEYPYRESHEVVRALFEAFGADRLLWGSDYPVVRTHMTHRHALEAFRTHCDFIAETDRRRILGPSLKALLDGAGGGR